MALLCADCSMVFSSGSLLQRHQIQLCVGKAAGDPIAARKEPETQAADRGIGVESRRTTTPELIKKRNNNQGIVDAAPNADRVEEEKRPRRQENHPLKTLSDEVPGGRAGQDTRLRLMEERTKLHKTRLAQIHDHNQQLQRQREELFQQMGALSGQTTASHLENLLVQQKDKEDRSEEILRQLTRRLDTLQVESIATNQPGPDRNRAHSLNFDLLRSSTDGPLSSQIREMQAAYVQSGGSDPGLLAQMMDLQREAQRLEQAPLEAEAKGRRKKVRPYRRGPNRELLALEAENRRLEHEILQIQTVRPYGDQGSSSLSLVEAELQQEQLYCMVDIKAEMEALRLEIRERSKGVARTCRQAPPPPPPSQRPPPPVYPAQQAPNPLVRWTRSVDEGYDSAPGDVPRMDRRDPRVELVLFYDMVVGIDARLSMLRLVSSLYLGEQQMGLPAPLPCVLCQPGVEMPFSQQLPPGVYAPLLVKQPVPRKVHLSLVQRTVL
ncbi:coiled-coil domain-containing protein 17 isoform X2 [Gadus morhua]|uniref:coiled-coil domain-containing protein 17 isoform X2 n=1 Tax=Gadus morhua TaxID=8049 RepID=UPI0011B71EEF|nr:coiled-coil domain-containing protein 17 isoform X2 [Gadus morhua]